MKPLLIFAATSIGATAYAAPLPLVVAPPDGCPNQAAVDAELQRLLPTPPPLAYSADLFVADHGDSYEVTVCGAQRIFVDATRDCAERARIAAVTLAVTLAPPAVVFAEPASPPPQVVVAPPPPMVVAPPTLVIPRAAPPPPRRRQFLLSLDVGSAYRGVDQHSYAAAELDLKLGAEFSRWGIALTSMFTIGADESYRRLWEATVGPSVIVKATSRVRLGFGLAAGAGQSKLPSYGDDVSSVLVALGAELVVDLHRSGGHALYFVLSPGVTGWVMRRIPVYATYAGPGGISSWSYEDRLPNAFEATVRAGLGYRFNH